ncbi:MAG: histidine phosphatase family protein [Acidimicrobiales bacterium]
MGHLLVLRHAQSVWNAAGRWQGWTDAPLSPLGAEQARKAGRALASLGTSPDRVASSDLARARQTAELLAAELGYEGPFVVDPDLREQELGQWNGLTREEIEARWPGQIEARGAGRLDRVPGGETRRAFFERAMGALGRLGAGGDDVLAVTHGGVVMALERALGIWHEGNRHGNLSGWRLEAKGSPPNLDLVPLEHLDLLAMGAETVTGSA